MPLSGDAFVEEILQTVRTKHSKDNPIIGLIERGEIDREALKGFVGQFYLFFPKPFPKPIAAMLGRCPDDPELEKMWIENVVAVGLALAELDGVEGGHAAVGFAEAGGVEDALHALTGVQVVVVAAGVADAVPVVAARARQVGVAGEAARKALLPGTVTGAISTKQGTKGHACECIKRLRPGLCRRAPRGTRPRSWDRECPPVRGR